MHEILGKKYFLSTLVVRPNTFNDGFRAAHTTSSLRKSTAVPFKGRKQNTDTCKSRKLRAKMAVWLKDQYKLHVFISNVKIDFHYFLFTFWFNWSYVVKVCLEIFHISYAILFAWIIFLELVARLLIHLFFFKFPIPKIWELSCILTEKDRLQISLHQN